jgi:DNA-binding CsgD family transcriptional regulator
MSPNVGFLLQDQIIPRLKSAIPQAVSFIGSEDAQELVQDGALIAAQMIHNAEQAGKKVVRNPGTGRQGTRKVRTISAGNVAFYTIQKLKCGRRSTGSSTVDVYGSGTQINGATRLTSLEDVAAIDEETGGEIYFHDVLSRDEECPATKAARNLDWQSFMASLSARDQAIIQFTIEGRTSSSMARQLGVCPSTIQHRKKNLALKILEFLGADILIEVCKSPRWKQDLQATREKMACREERRH